MKSSVFTMFTALAIAALLSAASALKPGSSVNGNWTDSDRTLSGRYII